MDRARIDEVRRLLVESFMNEDMTTYSRCAVELETLIGVEHGDRNPKANGAEIVNAMRSSQKRKAVSALAIKARYGKRLIEVDADGAYSVRYQP